MESMKMFYLFLTFRVVYSLPNRKTTLHGTNPARGLGLGSVENGKENKNKKSGTAPPSTLLEYQKYLQPMIPTKRFDISPP